MIFLHLLGDSELKVPLYQDFMNGELDNVQALKAFRGSIDVATFVLNSGASLRSVINITPRSALPLGTNSGTH